MKWLVFAMIIVIACDKKDGTSPSASASASPAALPSASAPAAPVVLNSFSGSYTAAGATFFVPDGGEWSGVKFRGEDSGDGLGAGTLSITIDPATHALTGKVDGALGVLTVSGMRNDDDVTFTVSADKPSDETFYGTGDGKVVGGKLVGTIRASRARANVIREATFSLDGK